LLKERGDDTLDRIHINEKLQQVDIFKYLGALVTDDAECTKYIRARLGNGTGNLRSMQRLW